MTALQKSLDEDSEEWKKVIPGKILVNKFAALAKLDAGRLKTLYIRQVEKNGSDVFEDIVEIFQHFAVA